MMMERILLVVLYLSGWYIFSTCLLHKYQFVADHMNWTDAQTYCREKYTDLATIENNEDRRQIMNTFTPDGSYQFIWTGLYGIVDWRWSDGYNGSGSDYRRWKNYLAISDVKYVCAAIQENMWAQWNCLDKKSFICNNGTQLDPEFVFVEEKMSWSSAQRYCTENYRDLATVRNDTENQQIQNLTQGVSAWIGLFKVPENYRSDGNGPSFRYLNKSLNQNDLVRLECGAAFLYAALYWFVPCKRRYPFVCYSIPVKRQVVKLRIKPGNSVDLNDDTVKANILKEFQNKLKDKGVTGVTLKWKKQLDGKVFHKEGKSPQEKNRKKTEL